jgi:Phage integrase, N-terminal SAM-like domain
MGSTSAPRRTRIERGIYRQGNGNYAVCVMVDGRARFRTLAAATLAEARRQRQALQDGGRTGGLPLSPRLTFAEVAERWLAEFEAKVAAGGRRERTLDLYRSQLRRHLLPRLGRRRLRLITTDDVVALSCELQCEGLSAWTIKGILGTLSCVFSYALRRGYIGSHPFGRLERDERPHPPQGQQRVLSQGELARHRARLERAGEEVGEVAVRELRANLGAVRCLREARSPLVGSQAQNGPARLHELRGVPLADFLGPLLVQNAAGSRACA